MTMEMLLVFGRIVLAAVFAVAGLTKLLDRPGSRRAMIDFGVPVALAGAFGIALPLAEITVAAALVPAATAWLAAAVALALLLLFCVGIGANLARGRRPACRCFGQIHASPVGWRTLVRNGILTAVAGLVLWQGRAQAGPSLVGWLGDLSVMQAAGLVGGILVVGLLAAQGWIVLQLLRQQGRLLLRIEALEAGRGFDTPQPSTHGSAVDTHAGLPLGSQAPAFALADVHGATVTLDDLLVESTPLLLLFMDPRCGPCTALMPDVGRWQIEHEGRLQLAIVGRGDVAANRAKAAEHGVERVLLQVGDEVADAYQAYGTPSAVVVRPGGTIGSAVASGAEAIRSLVSHTIETPGAPAWAPPLPIHLLNGHEHPHDHDHAHAHGQPPAARIGEPAPALALPSLDGPIVDLADFRGRETLVLFWNPDCGFCQKMVPDLRAWEATSPAGAPTLLIVSTGSVEANREQGLRSPLLIDEQFSVGPTFGANGTPMAVLVDAEGRIASEPAAGAQAVFALAGSSRGLAAPLVNGASRDRI